MDLELLKTKTFRLLQDSPCRKCNDSFCKSFFDKIPAEDVYVGLTDGELKVFMWDNEECCGMREVEAEG